MKKYLKIGVLLLCLLTVPSLGAGAGCEGLDSSPRALCQRLEKIETNQQKILRNQEKLLRALSLSAEAHSHYFSDVVKDEIKSIRLVQ
jgi:hypothetical protein